MSYSQNSFKQRLGTGPYTIAEAGCFLVSFANILERFGIGINPLDLNNYFIQHNKYVDVDGDNTLDDLAWGTISAYDGRVTCVATGGAGWPNSNDSIVKFSYKSPRTGRPTIHFALVVDYTRGIILDPWDGTVKASPYGAPVAWAKYEFRAAQVVSPPPPVNVPTFSVEGIPEVEKELKINISRWDLAQRTWQDLVNHPAENKEAGYRFRTSAIGHHITGGSYYLVDGSTGFNVVDCKDPAPAPPPPPEPPKTYTQNTVDGITYEAEPGNPVQMFVSKQGGADKYNLTGVKSWRDFKAVEHYEYGEEVFIAGIAHHPIPPVGADYLITGADFGDFKTIGRPNNNYGFNHADLSTTRPAPINPPAPTAPIQDVVPVTVQPAPPVSETAPIETPSGPLDWRATYRPFVNRVGENAPVWYIAVQNTAVKPLDGKGPEVALHIGDRILIGGTFKGPDGSIQLRPQDAALKFLWHGIADGTGPSEIIAPETKVYNSTTTPAERKTLGTTTINDRLIFLADDMQKLTAILKKVWGTLPLKKTKKSTIKK